MPDEVSVIGFDDNPHCLYGNLMLTTVRQPLGRMAQLGVEVLKEVMVKNPSPRKVVLSPELVIRDTVTFKR